MKRAITTEVRADLPGTMGECADHSVPEPSTYLGYVGEVRVLTQSWDRRGCDRQGEPSAALLFRPKPGMAQVGLQCPNCRHHLFFTERKIHAEVKGISSHCPIAVWDLG